MTLQATAIFFDSNQPFLLERGKPGAFKQMALENALSCRNVSPIYGKHTTLGYAVCGVDHTVSLILDRSCVLVSIIRAGAFHQAKQPRFAANLTPFAEPSSTLQGGTFQRKTAQPVVRMFDTECATALHQANRGHAVGRAVHGVHALWYGDFWAKITTLTGPPVETKGRSHHARHC